MATDKSLITFKAIANFTNELSGIFSSKQRSLKLYNHLINKTTIAHDVAIKKHEDAFQKFCISNRDALSTKNKNDLAEPLIMYSNRVYIDIKNILQQADSDTQTIIWNHLLYISALVDPAGNAKQLIKNIKTNTTANKDDFLSNILSTVESQLEQTPNATPAEAISNLMSSGIVNDFMGGLTSGSADGSINIENMLGTITSLMGKLNNTGDNPELNQPVDMMKNMLSNSTNNGSSGEDGDNGGIEGMMSMLGPLMNTLGKGIPKNVNIEDMVQSKLKEM